MTKKQIHRTLNLMPLDSVRTVRGFEVYKARENGFVKFMLAADGFKSAHMNIEDAAEWIANA